jgi:3-hydroxyacyl-[acyl-carrier-protein] dehydratase
MPHVTQACVPADHPCFAGHFPGNPVVPAVVLLEQVEQALALAVARGVRIARLPSVKFLRPLGPGVSFDIALDVDPESLTANFRCTAGGQDLATGRLGYVLR